MPALFFLLAVMFCAAVGSVTGWYFEIPPRGFILTSVFGALTTIIALAVLWFITQAVMSFVRLVTGRNTTVEEK